MRKKLKLLVLFSTVVLWMHSNAIAASGNPDSPENSSVNISSGEILNIGSRLELFADDYLIDHLDGDAELRLHHPQPKEIIMVHDEPWEGNGCGFHTIFKDGDKFRMYYKSWKHSIYKPFTHPLYTCYAESDDGIHWGKPILGLYNFGESKANNIVFDGGEFKNPNAAAIFRDNNPNVAPDALYKAIRRGVLDEKFGLFVYKSPDGIHWTRITDYPVITDGAFDSQNLIFWDSEIKEYRAYWRYFTKETDDKRFSGVRAIRTAKSKDLVNWYEQKNLVYKDSPLEHLYTNLIKPYYRAPHIYLGFPMRYIDRGWSESMRALPEPEHREFRAGFNQRYGTAITETLFMISRDGVLFKRWNEAFLRPGIEREGTWNYGHQCMGWTIVETESALEGAPNELSIYAVEGYWTGISSSLRRYTLRIDGFVSAYAPMSGGELVTKPLTFTGKNLVINFSSSAAGSIQVEIQDEDGNPVPGFTLEDCPPVFGDSLERIVHWENGNDLSALEGQPVRLKFFLKDADLFSLQFK